MQKWQCRWARSLGELEGSDQDTWGTVPHTNPHLPCVWFGLYGLPDFYSLWSHPGTKAILWAGSDITHFVNGYWLDNEGKIKLDPFALAEWIDKNCQSYVENHTEQARLLSMGIKSTVVPSFLGDVNAIEECYVWSKRPKVYSSVSGDNFEMYGWDVIERIADKCNVDFYLYGSNNWKTKHPNVHIQGRVPKERMNEDIEQMQCGLRLNEFDGFSEVLAKSILMAQHPISRIPYPHIDSYKNDEELIELLNNLVNKVDSNSVGRQYYLQTLNKFPWNDKNN